MPNIELLKAVQEAVARWEVNNVIIVPTDTLLMELEAVFAKELDEQKQPQN